MKRIVSLLPSATEIVCALGARDRLVGRSHECKYPEDVKSLPACTAARVDADASSSEINRQVESLLEQKLPLYTVDATLLRDLRPDVIITQKQCEVCAVSEDEVRSMVAKWPGNHPQIVSLSPQRLADVWADMQQVADLLQAKEQGSLVIKALKNRVVDIIEKTCSIATRPTIACIEWFDPLMAAGNWVPELVDLAGGKNLFGEAGKHSPWLTWAELSANNPDVLVLMPCGFDLARTIQEAKTLTDHPEWKTLRAVKRGQVYLVDGNAYFNRPGPRLVESLEILSEILHPQKFKFSHEMKSWRRLA